MTSWVLQELSEVEIKHLKNILEYVIEKNAAALIRSRIRQKKYRDETEYKKVCDDVKSVTHKWKFKMLAARRNLRRKFLLQSDYNGGIKYLYACHIHNDKNFIFKHEFKALLEVINAEQEIEKLLKGESNAD